MSFDAFGASAVGGGGATATGTGTEVRAAIHAGWPPGSVIYHDGQCIRFLSIEPRRAGEGEGR